MKRLLIISIMVMTLFTSCKSRRSAPRNLYAGRDISNVAEIVRNRETKSALMNIDSKGRWSLYSGKTVETINFAEPVMEGHGEGTTYLSVRAHERVYFYLVVYNGRGVLAERRLPMTGAYNFRDLGGIQTKEGKYVKWGKLFRSDDLSSLTDEDLAYLESVNLTSVVDFRSEGEVAAAPDRMPSSVVNYYSYSVIPGNLQGVVENFSSIDPSSVDTLMMEMNSALVTDSAFVGRYRDFFMLLQNEANIPLVFHCSAGKDRTGLAAALILYALGVDEERIMKDYLLSNEFLEDKYAESIAQHPNLKALFMVKPEFLEAAFNGIKQNYGSVNNFLTDVLNVDIPKFKELYLY